MLLLFYICDVTTLNYICGVTTPNLKHLYIVCKFCFCRIFCWRPMPTILFYLFLSISSLGKMESGSGKLVFRVSVWFFFFFRFTGHRTRDKQYQGNFTQSVYERNGSDIFWNSFHNILLKIRRKPICSGLQLLNIGFNHRKFTWLLA